MLRDHDYDALTTETLGHAAAATGLIAQSLKFDGAVTLQIQSSGVLRMLVMQCTSELDLRGMASAEPGKVATDFAALIEEGHCAVTVNVGERPYQGIVEIDDTSLAASLEHYFARSVQVPCHVVLVANEDVAGGVLLQQIPGQAIDEDDWNRLHFLAETLGFADFESAAGIKLIGKLFAEDDVRVYERRAVNFRCRCSQQKTEDVLKMQTRRERRWPSRATSRSSASIVGGNGHSMRWTSSGCSSKMSFRALTRFSNPPLQTQTRQTLAAASIAGISQSLGQLLPTGGPEVRKLAW
jgi:molecular chaperone Hsp33